MAKASKSKGVHCTYQAFCKPCGWQGAHWMSEGAAKNAHAEYRWHKEQQSHRDAENRLADEILKSNGRQRAAVKAREQAERDRMDNRHLPIGPAACRE